MHGCMRLMGFLKKGFCSTSKRVRIIEKFSFLET